MHIGRVSPFFTTLTVLLISLSLSPHDTMAGFYDGSCGPCGMQYVTRASELLEDVARKCGFDKKTLEKYNYRVNLEHYSLPAGSIIRIPCSGRHTVHNNPQDHESPVNSMPFLYSSLRELASSDSGTLTGSCGICGNIYEPTIGDTIDSIAKYCNISTDILRADNPRITDHNVTNSPLNISCADRRNYNCSVCGSWHHIKEEETLNYLADTCKITLFSLEHSNPGIDWDNIYPGQYINVPCGNPDLRVPLDRCGPCGIEYRAREATDIQQIIQICEIDEERLILLNPSLEGKAEALEGQILRLSCGHGNCGPCGSEFTLYTNETLLSVAAKCHVGTMALQLENPGVSFEGVILNNTGLKIPCNIKEEDGDLQSACSRNCNSSFQLKNETDVLTVSRMCNVSADLISYANNISESDQRIPGGKTVYVPCASVPDIRNGCSLCGSSIRLQAFVKLEDVAVLCNTTPDAIKQINPNVVLDKPGPGDNLRLPCDHNLDTGTSACGPCGISYVTGPDDSLPSAAVKCATMAGDIQSANLEIDFGDLKAHTVLNIPCSLSDLTSGSGARFKPHYFKFLVYWNYNQPATFLLEIFLSQFAMASAILVFLVINQ